MSGIDHDNPCERRSRKTLPLRYARVMDSFDTIRLHLRPLDASDEAFYCSLYTDLRLMRHIAAPMSPEAALHSFRVVLKHQGDSRLVWAIAERGKPECGILGVMPKDDVAEVGVMLLPPAQARGFAAEVIAAVADVLFKTGRFRWLWTRHAAANAPAAALMRRLGFERFEAVDAELPSAGVLPEQMRWRLTYEAWTASSEAAAMATARPSR